MRIGGSRSPAEGARPDALGLDHSADTAGLPAPLRGLAVGPKHVVHASVGEDGRARGGGPGLPCEMREAPTRHAYGAAPLRRRHAAARCLQPLRQPPSRGPRSASLPAESASLGGVNNLPRSHS